MRIESQQLGALEIPEDSVIEFRFGIPGFNHAHRFCLLEVKPGSRFQLLQCTHDPNLAFVVTDPLLVAPDYPLAAIQQLAAPAGIEPDEPLGVAAIVTVPPPPRRPTANLLAPVAIGTRSRLGAQVVLHDSPYQVRHEL